MTVERFAFDAEYREDGNVLYQLLASNNVESVGLVTRVFGVVECPQSHRTGR